MIFKILQSTKQLRRTISRYGLVVMLLGSISCEMTEPTSEQRDRLRPSDLEEGRAIESDVLVAYDYLTGSGEAELSDQFHVEVKVGDGEFVAVDVLMSDPDSEKLKAMRAESNAGVESDLLAQIVDGIYNHSASSYRTTALKRSFSFVHLSYDNSRGEELTFRVTPIGDVAPVVPRVSPRSYGVLPAASAEKSGAYEFKVYAPNKYMSVDFMGAENLDQIRNGTSGPVYDWIRHMLCVFVDPMEDSSVPKIGDTGVVEFTEEVTEAELSAASTIYFPRGHYNLLAMPKGAVVDAAGVLRLKENQAVYIEGGAYVEGLIYKIGSSNYGNRISVSGRGILSGRRYVWDKSSEIFFNGVEISNKLIHGGEASEFEGIMIMDAPAHGIVSSNNCKFDNVKMLGWHENNDGFRPGFGTEIKNCFLRACDDFFYNYDLLVKDCVLWPMFNGSILTYGWQDIDLGGSELDNIDIINSEWISMGNNKGLVMSQNEAGFKVSEEYGRTRLSNIRFEGKIPAFINIKPADGYFYNTVPAQFAPIPSSGIGWIGYLDLVNITIDEMVGEQDKSTVLTGLKMNQITGATQCADLADRWAPHKNSGNSYTKAVICSDNNSVKWMARDITFTNVKIGNTILTKDEAEKYFYVDSNSTEDIYFEGEKWQ